MIEPTGQRDRSNRVDGGYGLASGLFLLGALALAWPWLSGIVTIPWDAKAQAWPQIAFLARSLAAGESPFWTPNVFAGHPQIADPQSLIFSPPYLLLAWLDAAPSFQAADAVTFAMLSLAGLAIIALFKDRAWHAAGGMVAAFSFAFGGSAAWRLQHTGEVLSLCWFAITLFLLERALARGSLLYGFMAGVIAGCMVLGRDQIAYLCTLVLIFRVLWHLVSGRGMTARLRRAIWPLLMGLLGGTLVVAVPLALTISLAAQSNRPEIDLAAAGRGSLPPLSFLTAIVANLYGTDGPLKDFWGPPSSLVWGETDLALARNMGAIYFGALPLVALLVVGVGRGALWARPVRVFAVAALVMALYAVGRYTPVFRVAFLIPGVDLYRRPADATFPLCALLSILSGWCVHRAILDPPARRRAAAFLLVLGGFAACVLVAADRGRLAQAADALATGGVFLAEAVAALVVAPRMSASHPRATMIGLAVLMVFDLGVSNKPNESTALPPQTYDVLRFGTRNETIALIERELAADEGPDRRDRVELAAVDFEWPGAGLVHGFDHDLGYNPVRLKLYTDATNALDQVAVPDQRVFSPLYPGFRSLMADLLGVRLVLSSHTLEQMDKSFKPGDLDYVGRTHDAFVWRNPRALPRVLMPGQAQGADFADLMQKGWPAFDPRSTVLLETPSDDALASRQSGDVTIAAYRNTEVIVDARSPEGGFVVLNDVWQPWWFAEVDGRPAELLRANVIFRAVRVPAGAHRVRFVFRPLQGLWKEWRGG